MPESDTRAKYDALQRHDTVTNFVSAFRQVMRQLSGTVYHPAGSAVIDFLRKLKEPVRKCVQDNAPDGWYQDLNQLY